MAKMLAIVIVNSEGVGEGSDVTNIWACWCARMLSAAMHGGCPVKGRRVKKIAQQACHAGHLRLCECMWRLCFVQLMWVYGSVEVIGCVCTCMQWVHSIGSPNEHYPAQLPSKDNPS